MTAIRQHRTQFSEEEYLYLEERSETRNEFFNGAIFATAGGSFNHSTIGGNVLTTLTTRLRGSSYRPFNNDLRIYVLQNGLYTYPDASVICGKPELLPGREDTVTNPTLIVEVLSPSTMDYDLGAKFELYSNLSSLREYVLVWQDETRVHTYVRQTMGQWLLSKFIGEAAVVLLPSLDLEIPISELYENVDWFEQ